MTRTSYATSGRKIWYDSYIEACIVWVLKDIRKENPIENQMYLDLKIAANRTGASELEPEEPSCRFCSWILDWMRVGSKYDEKKNV